jgi:hypothetical protein
MTYLTASRWRGETAPAWIFIAKRQVRRRMIDFMRGPFRGDKSSNPGALYRVTR